MNDGMQTVKGAIRIVALCVIATVAQADSTPMESVGGTVMPFGGSSFGGDAEKAAERMRIVKARGGISRFVMSGIGSSVRVNGIKGPEAYTALGRHIANVQRKVAADGIKIGFFMSPTLNCGINHPWAKFRNFDGTERAFTACPGEEGFRKDLAAKAAALAAERENNDGHLTIDTTAYFRNLPFVTARGDVSGDGAVNAKDVTVLRRGIAGGFDLTIPEELADLNRDGAVNAKDVTFLRRALAGGDGITLE